MSFRQDKISEEKYREIYFQYYPVIFPVAMYVLKHEPEAEDAVQDVFLKLWSRREQVKDINNLKAYLIRMTKNTALDRVKEQDRNDELSLKLKTEELDEQVEESREEQIREVLEKAVSKLPPKCRLIFSLSRFEGLSNDEIAEYLDISKRTVETQISIALKTFRGEMRPYFEENLPFLSPFIIGLLLQSL